MKKAFEFLTHLKENNNREWFTQHKSEYDIIVKENKVFLIRSIRNFRSMISLKEFTF